MISSKVAKASALIFFDGDCGACTRYVQWLLDHDQKKQLGFAPLEGRTARFLLGELAYEESMVLMDATGTYTHSDAFFRGILAASPNSFWAELALFVPKSIRDFGYHLFSRFRRKVAIPICRILDDSERERFFD